MSFDNQNQAELLIVVPGYLLAAAAAHPLSLSLLERGHSSKLIELVNDIDYSSQVDDSVGLGCPVATSLSKWRLWREHFRRGSSIEPEEKTYHSPRPSICSLTLSLKATQHFHDLEAPILLSRLIAAPKMQRPPLLESGQGPFNTPHDDVFRKMIEARPYCSTGHRNDR